MQKPIEENDLRKIVLYAERANLSVAAMEAGVLSSTEAGTLLRADIKAISELADSRTTPVTK